MFDLILTQTAFLLCMAIFVRLFTFRRGELKFHRMKSCLAWLVIACSATTAVHILMGQLKLAAPAWPIVVLLGVFAWGIWRAGGNLAGVLRSDEAVWFGIERRK